MSEKEYTLPLPAGTTKLSGLITVNASILAELKANIAQVEKQIEAEKPKLWDFCLGPNDLHIMTSKGWSFASDPGRPVDSLMSKDIRILGNLKATVEQGPIVAGFQPNMALAVCDYLRSIGYGVAADNIGAALARYEGNAGQ